MNVPAWGGRRLTNALARVRQHWRGLPCGICGQPIDYDDTTTDHRLSIDHVIARSVRPDLTWDETNWQPTHRSCNVRRQANTLEHQGVTSRAW